MPKRFFYPIVEFQEATFRKRIGEPTEFDAAIGMIIESFAFLEKALSRLITMFIAVDNDIGKIITSELSFKVQVHIAASLFKIKSQRGDFVDEFNDNEERIKELMTLCFSAEEKRNQIVHSSFVANRFRTKTTAKAKTGLKTTVHEISPDRLLDISDFISGVGMAVQELPMMLGMATSATGGPKGIKYFDGETLMWTFEDLT